MGSIRFLHGTNFSNAANQPVLCASCHPSPALGINNGSQEYLSQVIHSSIQPEEHHVTIVINHQEVIMKLMSSGKSTEEPILKNQLVAGHVIHQYQPIPLTGLMTIRGRTQIKIRPELSFFAKNLRQFFFKYEKP